MRWRPGKFTIPTDLLARGRREEREREGRGRRERELDSTKFGKN